MIKVFRLESGSNSKQYWNIIDFVTVKKREPVEQLGIEDTDYGVNGNKRKSFDQLI